jgi:WD40 repeat protein/serine/threonine protein kinase
VALCFQQFFPNKLFFFLGVRLTLVIAAAKKYDQDLPHVNGRLAVRGRTMPIDSPAELVRLIETYRLLEPGQFRQLTQSLLASFAEPRALAQDLVRRGWLSPFQARRLFHDRGQELVLGPYTLMDRLGKGGMGAVYKARHQVFNRLVALKVIDKEYLDNPDAVRRFYREVRAAAQLVHPNIVLAYDADEIDGHQVLCMEYVDGIDLDRLVKDKGPLPIHKACDYVRQTALGLQHAFERDMVHRDIKPSNLLLARVKTAATPDSTPVQLVKILDMGLARFDRTALPGEISAELTHKGAVLGTPDYIAPEQARDAHSADIRSDLYSLGCTFYYLLTGKPPFSGEAGVEILLKHVLDKVTPISQLRPEVPAEVAVIIDRLMAKLPEERYQTPAEVVTALDDRIPDGLRGVSASSGEHRALSAPVTTRAQGNTCSEFEQDEIVVLDRPEPPNNVTMETLGEVAALQDTSELDKSNRQRELLHQRRLRKRITTAGAVALVILVGVALGLLLREFLPRGTVPPGARSPTLEARAAAALQPLLAQKDDPQVDQGTLRAELVTFRETFAGTLQAGEALSLLRQLPSPLDKLSPTLAEHLPWYPAELITVLGDPRWRHWGPIQALGVSADGRQVASVGADRLIFVREAASGQLRWLLGGHAQALSALAFADDGLTLASGSVDGSVILWDLNTGMERMHLPAHKGVVRSLAFAPDGRMLATASDDKEAKLWDLSDGKERFTLSGHTGSVRSVVFSPDGKRLATASVEDNVRLWDTSTGQLSVSLPDAFGRGTSLAFSPDGGTLCLALGSGGIRLWDLSSNQERLLLTGGQGPVGYTDNGQLVSGNGGAGLIVWDLAENKTRLTLPASLSGKLTMLSCASKAKSIATGDDQGEVRLWNPADGQALAAPVARWTKGALSFMPDGVSLVAVCPDQSCRCWDGAVGKERVLTPTQPIPVNSLACSPDGRTLALAGGDGLVQLWDLATGKDRAQPLRPAADALECIAYSPDGQLVATGGRDGAVKIWDATNGVLRQTLHSHAGRVWAVTFSPDGKSLASAGEDKIIRLWNVENSLKAGRELLGHSAPITTLTFSSDGQALASGSADGTVRLWDMNGKQTRVLQGHAARVRGMVLSPDGQQVITAAEDGRIIFWEPSAPQPVRQWTFPGPLTGLALSVEGRYLAVSGGDGCLYLFRLRPARG